MTPAYFQNRARQIMSEKHLFPLLLMVCKVSIDELQELLRTAPGVVEMALVNYLQEAN